ncbi:hypothetical protein N474_01210 [Pseudoalteromonas luteoviolacea CPMOR-2]|uniref:Uncharacterized protein n=1 Tax=Pseudoalteromonas luteoviolacea DSM 6061 TaxID=1365250 RepID=A0A166WWG4_9GAMM|nr:hypothetical protein N475_16125 [Pseudoalteromonas luteoviolacea DSM 6061]KZN54359.1 hypothetical protein N474_01210 [Pseudoalteromonas luteoviolacea CPMOR-2]
MKATFTKKLKVLSNENLSVVRFLNIKWQVNLPLGTVMNLQRNRNKYFIVYKSEAA